MTDNTGLDRVLHVALTVPADALNECGRADIVRFFQELFGWQEHPTLTIDRKVLVLGADAYEPLLFLHAAKSPMVVAGHEHFALGVDSLEKLQAVIAKAEHFAASDDRTKVSKYTMQDYGVAKIHSFFIRYLLPFKVEVQFFERVADTR